MKSDSSSVDAEIVKIRQLGFEQINPALCLILIFVFELKSSLSIFKILPNGCTLWAVAVSLLCMLIDLFKFKGF